MENESVCSAVGYSVPLIIDRLLELSLKQNSCTLVVIRQQ